MEDPQILILDEPFNGLDKDGIAHIHTLLQNLKSQGKCILLRSLSQNQNHESKHDPTSVEADVRSCFILDVYWLWVI